MQEQKPEKPLQWKRPGPLSGLPGKSTDEGADASVGRDALYLLAEFFAKKGVGTAFMLAEAQGVLTKNLYNIYSASARLSECCQAGAIESTGRAKFTVRKLLTADEIKKKRN